MSVPAYSRSDADVAGPSSASIWRDALVPPLVCIVFAVAMYPLRYVLGPYSEKIAIDIAVAIIAAVSLTIVNGFTGQFSIGHAAFMALGGYVGGWISYYSAIAIYDTSTNIPAGPLHPIPWIMVGGAIVGGLVAAAAGYLVGLPSLRLRGDYLAIVTLGFGEILRVLFQQTGGQLYSRAEIHETLANPDRGILRFVTSVGGATGFGSIPKTANLFTAYLFVGVTVLFTYRLKRSSYGRAMLSIREDDIAAEAMGVNVKKLKVRAFVIAAFFAGVAGTLYAHTGTPLTPGEAGFARSFDIVMMVVLGGLGSISGSVLAAILVTALNAFLTPYPQYRMIIFALMLILVMIFRPRGLFGIREIWDYFKPREDPGEGFPVQQPHTHSPS